MGFDFTGIGEVAGFAKAVVARILPEKMSEVEKEGAKFKIQDMLVNRDAERDKMQFDAQKTIITAEMEQQDKYTKRARPSVVYMGLFFIFMTSIIGPMINWVLLAFAPYATPFPELSLPSQFWWTWGGVCSVWVAGRTAEKRGMSNKLIQTITGH